MNLALFKKLPGIAREAQDKVSSAINQFKREDANYFFQDNLNQEQLNKLLASQYPQEILEAIKRILALLLLGKKVNQFTPRIIQLLPSDQPEIVRLCHYLLVEISCDTIEKDELLMCISPLHKQILSQVIVQRADALKTISSINISEISSLITATINKLLADRSSYMRRISCQALQKVINFNNEDLDLDSCLQNFSYLLKDTPYAKGRALICLWENSPDQMMTYLHSHFNKICQELHQYNCFDLPFILQMLHSYSIIYFSFVKDKTINQNNEFKDIIHLNKLLDSCERLLHGNHPSIILEVGNIFLNFPREDKIKKLVKALIRFINISSESKFIILYMLEQIAIRFPATLKDYYRSFFIIQLEKIYCKVKKIHILYYLVDPMTISLILDELSYYTRSIQKEIVAAAVECIAKIALKNTQFLNRCTKLLIGLLKHSQGELLDYVVMHLITLIRNDIKQFLPVLSYCLKYTSVITNSKSKCRLISVLIDATELIPTLSIDYLRILSQQYTNSTVQVKQLILCLAFKLLFTINYEAEYFVKTISLFRYILMICLFDRSIIVRDQARLIQNLLFPQVKIEQITEINDEKLVEYLITFKDSKVLQNITRCFDSTDKNIQLAMEQGNVQIHNHNYTIGSLSQLIKHKVAGYKLLPKEEMIMKNSTYQFREINLEQEKLKQQQQQQQQQNVQKVQQQQQVQQIIDVQAAAQAILNNNKVPDTQNDNQQKSKKELDKEIAQKFGNLNKVLDDFFQDE